jgi:microcystin degradation protein MlrC
MRLFAATLATETNTFAPMPTGLADFQGAGGYFPAGQHPPQATLFSAPLVAARLRAAEQGHTLAEGLVAMAQPSGTTTRAAYETLRDQLLADLQAALPVQVVLLGLHGAMVADGYDDCEGDLLQRVRSLVGPGVVVGAELDPHCHLSETMVASADLLVAFKEYPHTDAMPRALELVDLCLAQAQGRIRPVAAVADTGMISIIHTTREPGRGFVDRIQALEGHNGVLSISVAHGFPWGDVADMGTRVLVYTDATAEVNAQANVEIKAGDSAKAIQAQTQAERLAKNLAAELYALRETLMRPYPGIDAALDQALAVQAGPVVLADSADNAGGGAASDATFVLRRLLERGITSAALGPLWDPGAVRIAFAAGVGASLPLRIGGKVGPMSGAPLDAQCTVLALKHQLVMTGLGGTQQPMGDCALVQTRGVSIVLCSVRSQAFDTDLFTQLGCDLLQQALVVVKSSQHFYASYAKIAKAVIYIDAPGSVTQDLNSLPYRKVRRPRWPLVG